MSGILSEKRRMNLRELAGYFLFYVMAFGIMFVRHYSLDSYRYSAEYTTAWKGNLALGRFGNYLIFGLFRNVNIVSSQKWFVLLLMAALAVCTKLLCGHMKKCAGAVSDLWILNLSVIVVFCNIFMLEFFLFIEMVLAWVCGLAFVTASVLAADGQLGWKRMGAVTLLMFCAVSFYQSMLGVFIYFVLISVYLKNNGNLAGTAFLDSVKLLMCGGTAGAANILLLRAAQFLGVEQTNRTGSLDAVQVWNNVKDVCNGIKVLTANANGLMPKYFVLYILEGFYALIIIVLLRKRKGWKDWLYLVLIVISCRLVIYIPHLLATTVWMTPRSMIGYWSLISLPCVVLWTIAEHGRLRNAAGILTAIVIMVHFVQIQDIGANIIASNRMDEQMAYDIQQRISRYEYETGKEVQKIVFGLDEYPSWKYRSIRYSAFEICQRAYTSAWGAVTCMNYFNGRDYESEWMDADTYQQYFKTDNWDEADLDEQLVFQGNTLYMAVY